MVYERLRPSNFPTGEGLARNPEVEIQEKYALVSVYNKEGIVDFARILDQQGYRIISTGGTARALTERGLNVIPIQEITGNPECLDGRMKTISFEVEAGIIYDRKKPEHVTQAQELGIKPIDIVVCNLYPFEQTAARQDASFGEVIENIDVGGPTMIRAAAKNHQNVLVVVDPKDYPVVAQALQNGEVTPDLRRSLATKAFSLLSFYDAQVARYLNKEQFPELVALPGRRTRELRYGENPHQKAALYLEPNVHSVLANLQRLGGRELSLVNVTDINAGVESVRLFLEPAAVVIKHNSPCGIALGTSIDEALGRAIEADPESAFGGVIVLNKPMDMATARIIGSFKEEGSNIDIVAAPEIDSEALNYVRTVRKSTGVYSFGEIPSQPAKFNIKPVDGGFVLQTADTGIDESFTQWKIVTEIQPTGEQCRQMEIAWKFVSRIKSNTVLVVDKHLPMTRGIGSGQTSRFRATKIALEQATGYTQGGILASDSFFPFGDSVKLVSDYKIGAIVQQGGSINDEQSIQLANRFQIPMVFTGRRAFWH